MHDEDTMHEEDSMYESHPDLVRIMHDERFRRLRRGRGADRGPSRRRAVASRPRRER